MARRNDRRRILEARLAGSRRRLADLRSRGNAIPEEIEDVEAHIAALEARLGLHPT